MVEKVNIGSGEDDGTGDSLRVAFEKVNENFEALARTMARLSAEAGDKAAGRLAEWPGSYVARHVTDTAPDAPPPMLGAVWVDASAKVVYVSVGTDSEDDWVQLVRKDG